MIKVKDIKIHPKNPRVMGKEAKRALSKSISEFNDISGITINKRTNNILTGNHRWEELLNNYDKDDITFSHLRGEYYAIDSKDGFTGFLIRVVDWSETKELSANVVANSSLIQGEFTSGLQVVLKDIALDTNNLVFEELRLDELQIDLDDIDDLEFDPNALDASARKRNDELDDADDMKSSDVREIITTVKINVPGELKDIVKQDIIEALEGKDYFKEIKIL